MDTLSNYNNTEGTAWDDTLETKMNEIIAKVNEIVTWINSQ